MNAPLPPFQPAATSSVSTSAPRARTQQRKRNADDAPYAGPAPSGKRVRATDGDGGPTRTAKRRRPSTSLYAGGAPALPSLSSLYAGGEPTAESMVDFTTLATPDLHEYLLRFDLVPDIFPSPLSIMDPPAPSMLLTDDGEFDDDEAQYDDPARVPAPPSPSSSRTPTPPATPATRARRLTDASSYSSTHRRRVSRFSDADDTSSVSSKRRRSRARTPILADVGDVQAVLAAIAQRHFQDQHLAEGDALSSFMAKLKRRPRTRSVDTY